MKCGDKLSHLSLNKELAMKMYFKQLGLAALLLCSGACVGLHASEPYDSIRLLPDEPYFIENR